MIITRSPLRISLGGGGTDLPPYYHEHGGFVIAAAINKYVYIHVNRRFVDGFLLKYSKLEEVAQVEDIEHPIIRECLNMAGIEDRNLEITSMADIPTGTGLGSSGSFTTALLRALYTYKRRPILPSELAEDACCIEMEWLGEPVGKQDQYIAAYGGIMCFDFYADDRVGVSRLHISDETRFNLEDNLLLFFTGYSRSASDVLKEQANYRDNLHRVKQIGLLSKEALEKGDLQWFARLMSDQWKLKKQRGAGVSNATIDRCYDCAMKNGALGGKLVGAGGGGFLMFYVDDKSRLRHAMKQHGLREVRFRFDFEGTRVLSYE